MDDGSEDQLEQNSRHLTINVCWLAVRWPREDLLASREDRRYWAEESIRNLVSWRKLQPSPTAVGSQTWGTDSSMIPASASLCESRRVTAAVTGPLTLVVQLSGRNLSILHGELMGHVLALVLRKDSEGNTPRLSVERDERPALLSLDTGSVPLSPIPTFTMDTCTLFTKADGWIETNIRTFVDFFLAKEAASKLGNRAFSRHPALCSLWSTSDGRDIGIEVQTRILSMKLEEADMREEDRQPILNAAKSLFIDDPAVWPLKISQYYLSQTPSIQNFITYRTLPDTIKRRKLASHLSSDWHTSAIRLAGRIFGSVQRTMAARAAAG
ncbi:hypothetical protein B0H14DRAFT_2563254 [Mycena olivaceomarginata]|nr:hypothetical protein B0H14DRAFT_2563254 [Mycena olivaceomarginata]